MSLDNRPIYSGGCQCGKGALPRRGRARRGLDLPLPHVPEGQRQFLSAAGLGARREGSTWTRGEPKHFQSSNHARRGFCGDCGTPLTFEAPDGVALAIAAFDDPAVIAPTIQWGVEAKLPYVDAIPALPGEDTMADVASAPYLADLVSYQHPDHDTEQWPLERAARMSSKK